MSSVLDNSVYIIVFLIVFTGHGSDTSNTTEEALKLIRRSLKSNSMDRVEGTHFDGTYPHVFVTFGASVSDFIFHFYPFALFTTDFLNF